MMNLKIVRVVVLMGAVVSLAACGSSASSIRSGVDLAEVQARLDRAIRESEDDTVSAMIRAIDANSEELVDIAQTCDKQGVPDSMKLDVHCLAVSSHAYLLLAELPERPSELDTDPALLAEALLNRSNAPCARLQNNPHCHAIEGFRGLLASGSAARELRHVAMDEGDVNPTFVKSRLATFGVQARNDWPDLLRESGQSTDEAGAIEARRREMVNQACYVYWSTSAITASPALPVAELNPVTDASREALWSAVNAAQLPPADPAACTVDGSVECSASRYFRLVRSCGPMPFDGA